MYVFQDKSDVHWLKRSILVNKGVATIFIERKVVF